MLSEPNTLLLPVHSLLLPSLHFTTTADHHHHCPPPQTSPPLFHSFEFSMILIWIWIWLPDFFLILSSDVVLAAVPDFAGHLLCRRSQPPIFALSATHQTHPGSHSSSPTELDFR
ncbi:hypothetical protein Droror1_Dr00022969 [Drosera rotundifolia]